MKLGKIFYSSLLLVFGGLFSTVSYSQTSNDVEQYQSGLKAKGLMLEPGVTVSEAPFKGFVIQHEGRFGLSSSSMSSVNGRVSGVQRGWSQRKDYGEKYTKLTEKEFLELQQLLFTQIRPGVAIGPYGNGSQDVYVVCSPDCPVCTQFRKDMDKYLAKSDLRLFFIPSMLRGDEDAFRRNIACSPDPNKAWEDAWYKKKNPANRPGCLRGLQLSLLDELAHEKDQDGLVTPTPFFIKPDGTWSSGWPGQAAVDSAEVFKELIFLPRKQ